MKQTDEFDAFYVHARERLLVQTYALTGDLAASHRAVREAFVVAWHRWRKLQRLDDPEEVVRPHAWRLAQRRATARVWHRDERVDPGTKATLVALGKLPATQRRTLVLTQYASVTMAQMAREVGLPIEQAARELQAGAAQLALLRGIPTAALPGDFARLAESVSADPVPADVGSDPVRWPRAPLIRRAGARRRRRHTALGVVAAVTAVLVSGTLITDTSGVRPTLDRAPVAPTTVTPTALKAAGVMLPAADLLSAAEVDTGMSGTSGPSRRRWIVGHTNDNSAGTGLVLPCQQQRYADPRGAAALVRTFVAKDARGKPPASTVQFAEASRTRSAAQKTYDTTVAWFSACSTPRMQLVATRRPASVGDQAVQLVLRSWAHPVKTYVVGVARTGVYTTTTLTRETSARKPDPAASADVLASAIDGLCRLESSGGCAPSAVELAPHAPLPTGPQPALVGALDLPPVSKVDRPWVGTDPSAATTNLAATACDRTSFSGKFHGTPLRHGTTRTFLIPGAGLPDKFGLTETAAALPPHRAQAFVDEVRSKLAGCMDRSLGSTVTRIADRNDADTSLTVWRVSVEVSANQRVDYWMAILRNRTAVAQLGFIPTSDVTMADGAFLDLAQRALDRLPELRHP